MTYKVLYRKYRPERFDKIVGQSSIVNTLKTSVKEKSISHAYIFTGPRGTGKTSTAKILAKAINCENSIDGEPCEKCESCKNFLTSPDIIEIDAASNNGVDEIRELRNNVTLAPSSSKYKIYIIDEVHMLSQGAFNALLKTLEEPPSHVIFILATTEIYKVPITILSRCQRYDFKKIAQKDMIEHLSEICKEEEIKCTKESLNEIYDLSEGCLRDALSILDQASKISKEITVEKLIEEYNIVSKKDIDTLILSENNSEIEKVVDTIDNYENSGINSQKLIKGIIRRLEEIAIKIKLGQEKNFEFDFVKNLIDDLNKIYVDARINENTYTMLKIAFLKHINGTYKKEKIQEINQKSEPEKNQESESKYVVVAGKAIDIRINNCFVEANKKALETLINIWNKLDSKILADISLVDYVPVASSEKYAIFSTSEDSLSDLFNIKSETIEKLLKKNDIQTRVVAITEKRWIKEKEEYIKKRKTIKYEYMEEPQTKLDELEIKGDINNIFEDTKIEIS